MSACLDAALRYLGLGLSVIPIEPRGKAPLVPWKEFQGRRPTRALVVNWYRRWPDAGVAVVCGRISGLVVLDADPRNGDGLARIEHRLPPTPTAGTGGGGVTSTSPPAVSCSQRCRPSSPAWISKARLPTSSHRLRFILLAAPAGGQLVFSSS